MSARSGWLAWIGIGLLVAGVGPGCSGNTSTVSTGDDSAKQVSQNLNTIATAYRAATEKNKRPPKGPEELKPFLTNVTDQTGLFRSARDGEPFVIIWGTDPRTGLELKPLVIAYEKKGKGGDRFVFSVMGVTQMEAADFAAANFPPGHKP